MPRRPAACRTGSRPSLSCGEGETRHNVAQARSCMNLPTLPKSEERQHTVHRPIRYPPFWGTNIPLRESRLSDMRRTQCKSLMHVPPLLCWLSVDGRPDRDYRWDVACTCEPSGVKGRPMLPRASSSLCYYLDLHPLVSCSLVRRVLGCQCNSNGSGSLGGATGRRSPIYSPFEQLAL